MYIHSFKMISGIVWFFMPLVVVLLSLLILKALKVKINLSYIGVSIVIGAIFLIFGPQCLCNNLSEMIAGTVLSSFISSIVFLLLFMVIKWFFSKE